MIFLLFNSGKRCVGILSISGFLLVILYSCNTAHNHEDEKERHTSGEELAGMYCSSCHVYPSPHLLDKGSWEKGVLPNMGYRFGIYSDRTRDSLIEKGIAGRIVNQAGIFPEEQSLTDDAWELIRQFYLEQAPDTLPVSNTPLIKKGISTFNPVVPDFAIERPAVTQIKFHDDSKRYLLSDCSKEGHSTVTILDNRFRHITTLGLPHPVSNLTIVRDTLFILMMGHLIPSDEPAGQLIKAVKDADGKSYKGYSQVLKGLQRPVDIAYADLDDDGREDIVVCEFGNHTGSVSLFLNRGRGKYEKKILKREPGAIRVMVEDIDHDGRKDIIVLMAQGDEGIDIWYNRGKGEFTSERVLRFPPVYGSMSFSLADFNGDGHLDILYVNGDNADTSPVLKPYHGIRIFMNDGRQHFVEAYFFPQHGAYKAIAHDFDKDGDLDIASISFFPDFMHAPGDAFVYLKNVSRDQHLAFTASTFQGSEQGRWITMDMADIDEDGDEDLMLGSFTSMEILQDTTGTIIEEIRKKSPTFLILRNTTH